MTGTTGANDADCVPIAQLDPSATASGKSVQGIVTLIWPYSISSQTFSILLAEPDFRLRRQRGQVRVRFTGSSAKALARCDVQSADHVKLSLLNAQWEREESTLGTPGKGIEWELRFEESVALQIQREDQEPIHLNIDHPVSSPERRTGSPPPIDSPIQPQLLSTPVVFPAVPSRLQAWSTPAFLKRDRLSGNSYFGTDYDPFDEDDFRDNSRRKKTKYGRASNQWRFTEQDSSPESAAGSSSPVAEPSIVNGAETKSDQVHAKNTDTQVLENNKTIHKEQSNENQMIAHEALVDAGVQVDGSLTDQVTAETRTHDALTSPIVLPQNGIPPSEKTHSPPDPRGVELSESVDPVEVTMKTMPPPDAVDPSVSLNIEPLGQGATKSEHDRAAMFRQASQEIEPRFASAANVLENSQGKDVEGTETAENFKFTESQDVPISEARQIDVLPLIPRESPEISFIERPSQFEGSPRPSLKTNGTREIRDELVFAMPQASAQAPHKPQEHQFDTSDSDQDKSDMDSDTMEKESARDVVSPVQEPSSKTLDQYDLGEDQASILAVPKSHITESPTASLMEINRLGSVSPTEYNVDAVSPDQVARSAIEKHSQISSKPSDPLPQQVLSASALSSQDDIDHEDGKAPRETFVDSDAEENAQARGPSADILGGSDNGAEESTGDVLMDDGSLYRVPGDGDSGEEDVLVDDGSLDEANSGNDEGPLLFESETGAYYDPDMSSEEETVDEPDGEQEEENREVVAPQRKSTVQIITLDDSDEDNVDVARSQTDGASMSILSATVHQSPAINSLLSVQKGGSPVPSSPPPLPNTIPDSQVAAEAEETNSDIESVAAEVNEVDVSSPSVLGSDYHEDSEDLAEGEDTMARFPASSLSPEIPLERYIDPRLKNKVLTPDDTQSREQLSQASHLSLQSLREARDLPTPQLTQSRSSDILLPATLRHSSPSARSSSQAASEAVSSSPSHGAKSSAPIHRDPVDKPPKLKGRDETITTLTSSPSSRRVSIIPPSVSRWFAPRISHEVVPDSRSQSPAESGESVWSEEHDTSEEEVLVKGSEEMEIQEKEADEELPSSDIEAPPKPLTSKPVFHSTPPSASLSSAQLPISTPATGLRTSHAYYTPLSNLPSHFNTTTSTLSIVLASLPITRATSGPRDFHTTLFLTDPSSLQEQQQQSPLSSDLPPNNPFQASNLSTPPFTIARLFRPARLSLPQKPKEGDIILLRSLAVTSYSRTASLLSSNSSAWALFGNRQYIEPTVSGPPVEFGAEERGYVRGLWEWWDQLAESTKAGVKENVAEQVKKMEEKEEREKGKGRRLKGMGLRLAPGIK
ncbi:MAG: hypothetical protein Q9168_007153, partial [Polycauliona sp. 1 TL-2023]